MIIKQVNTPMIMEIEIELKEFLQGTNKKGLAFYYDKNPRTMRAWLQPHESEIGEMTGGAYTPRQMIIILKKLGPPLRMSIPEEQLEELYRLAS
jgi:hypothetical protein